MACHDGSPATLVETHHTPGDLNCTDCHNVMRDQVANLSHIKTSLAAFTANAAGTDFAPGTGAGICETCHTSTTYYNDSGAGAAHMTGVCTTCHTHDTGFTPPDDPADTPHDGITDCTLCHDGDTYVAGATLDSNNCLACHDGGTATEADTHFSSGLGSECTDCHNVMRVMSNTSHIKPVVNGETITFDGTIGSFADGDGGGICEVCHTSTNHHQTDGSAPGGQSHNDDKICTSCHTHPGDTAADDAFRDHLLSATCIGCHTGVPGTTYVTRDVVGSDFTQASRHVFGVTPDNWDCIVCHKEGDETAAEAGNASYNASLHPLGNDIVDLRDVDNASGAGWTWDKYDGTCANGSYDNITDCIDNSSTWTWSTDQMLTDMDDFCMTCHDADGASDIAVNSGGTAIVLGDGACTGSGELACTPFNDALRTPGTPGGTAGDVIPTERDEVLDVRIQFAPGNPSHHAVEINAYNSTSAWGAGAWASWILKNDTQITTVRETANLHCADCHTVDYNAHGGVNGYMLQASSIDDTCWLCHNSNVYSATGDSGSRFDHNVDSSRTMDPENGSLVGQYDTNFGSRCLLCHGGDPAVDGLGGIHGLPPTPTDWRTGEQRFRFQGGARLSFLPVDNWTGNGGDGTCYTQSSGTSWAQCSSHEGNSKSEDTSGYAYPRPTPVN